MKRILIVVALILSFTLTPVAASAQGMTFSQFVELLIAIGVISPAKASLARAAVNGSSVTATPLSVVSTSDWKTYRNTTDGFEVKYPASWRIQDDLSYTYNGVRSKMFRVISPTRTDLEGYKGKPVFYWIQFATNRDTSPDKIVPWEDRFVATDSAGAFYPQIADSIVKNSPEYTTARSIIASFKNITPTSNVTATPTATPTETVTPQAASVTTVYVGTSKAGMTLYYGDSLDINWAFNSGATSQQQAVYIVNDATYVATPVTTQNGIKSYSYTVGTDLKTGQYRIEVCADGACGWSNFFKVVTVGAITAQNVTTLGNSVLNPEAGVSWTKGQTYTINWTSSDNQNVSLSVRKSNGDYYYPIVSNLDVHSLVVQIYSWTVPTTFADGDYYISFKKADGTEFKSGTFHVYAQPIGMPLGTTGNWLTLYTPNGGLGESWQQGKTYMIKWSTTQPGSPISIYLRNITTGVPKVMINANTNYTNRYDFTVPTDLAPGKYKVELYSEGVLKASSDNSFDITSAPTPTPTPASSVSK